MHRSVLAAALWSLLAAMSFAGGSAPIQLKQPDGAAGDYFGFGAAISGNTIVVGAPYDAVGVSAYQGSASVFVKSGTTWVHQAKLTANDGGPYLYFGLVVAISGDTIVVGEQAAKIGNNLSQGAAYVFTRSGTVWTQQAKLIAGDGAANDHFGQAVAISGNSVIVGAPYHNLTTNGYQGSAYVFSRSGTTWTQQQRLTASDAAANDALGWSVAIDGDSAIVGAVGAASGKGAAYVFTRTGTVWTQQKKLLASDGDLYDDFGASVAIGADTAIVGADTDVVPGSTVPGSAYVFVRAGLDWSQQAHLFPGPPQLLAGGFEDRGAAAAGNFGNSVSLAGDTALVGAFADIVLGVQAQGSAYVFSRADTTWTRTKVLTSPDGLAYDSFANSVSISGKVAVSGTCGDDIDGKNNQGSAWIFSICPLDLNGDSVVDDADFVIFALAYNVLDCADPAMPAACPADFNNDGAVDDSDFVMFIAGYNLLVCP